MSKITEPIEISEGIYNLPNEMDNLYGSPYSYRIFKKMNLNTEFILRYSEKDETLVFNSIYYNDYDKADLSEDHCKSIIEKNIQVLVDKKNNNYVDPNVKDTIDERLLSLKNKVIGFSVGGGICQNHLVFYVLTNGTRSVFYLCVNIYYHKN